MCQTKYNINTLPLINKMIADQTIIRLQNAISKVGGKYKKSDLLKLSFEDFVCICAMNQIIVEFK